MKAKGLWIFGILSVLLVVAMLGIIDYGDNITGMAVGDDKTEEILVSVPRAIGNYLVKPSFTVESDYYFDDYTIISNNVKILYSRCYDKEDKSKCIEENINSINWGGLKPMVGGCDDGKEKEFYDFVEYVAECRDSVDSNCYCNNPADGRFSLSQKDGSVLIKMDGSDLVYELKNAKIRSDFEFEHSEENYIAKSENDLFETSDAANACRIGKKTFRMCAEGGKLLFSDKPVKYRFAMRFG